MALLVPLLLSLVLAAPFSRNGPLAAGRVGEVVVPDASNTATPARPSQDAPQETKIETPDIDKPPTPEHTGFRAMLVGLKGDIAHLPSRQNLYIAGIGGGLALGTHPFDETMNARISNQYAVLNTIFAPGKYYGDTPEQMGFSIGTWAIGRIWDKPKVSHLGMDLLRAQALTEIMVEPIKLITHRQRPDGSNYQSFPSGHAAITFAAATVIERHLGWKNSIIAYGVASYVAASRLHDNVHYLSDVVFGAAVGTLAGRTVTAHGRDAWALAPTVVPGGFAMLIERTNF